MKAKHLIESLEDTIQAARKYFTHDEALELADILEAWDKSVDTELLSAGIEHDDSSTTVYYHIDFKSNQPVTVTILPGRVKFLWWSNFKRAEFKFNTVEQLLEIISQEFGL